MVAISPKVSAPEGQTSSGAEAMAATPDAPNGATSPMTGISALPSCRERFRALLRKIGSGEHTSSGLTREEAREALEMMLTAQASPAQIGAFLIAHRIRRPEPQELAGMLDLYRERGPRLMSAGSHRPICFGMPLDGRTRTAPLYPLTALVLSAAGLPVVLHGGDRMPVKYGVTAIELFHRLGLDLSGLAMGAVQDGLDRHGLALVHQPEHFPLADALNGYREELGKRPPVASLELLWTAHRGDHLMVSGFVHPPTEARAWKALHLAGEEDLITVKGLEGGTDLPISRACITARVRSGESERMILHPRDHDCYAADPGWTDLPHWGEQALAALGGQGDLTTALVWNAGTYLWMAGLETTQEAGLAAARDLIRNGGVLSHLRGLIEWRTSVSG